jgi:LysM repeat protein
MDQGPEREMEDIMEEIPDDLGHNWKKEKNIRRRKSPSGFSPQGRPLVFWGLAILILIVLIGLFFGGGNNDVSEDLNSINARLEQIEKRLAQLEGMEQKLSPLETQLKRIEQSTAKLDRSRESLGAQLNKLTQKIDRLEKKAPSAPAKTKVPHSAREAEGRYHKVRSGDTLYGIAKKYGISVNDLRRLNKLTEKQSIYPGQKVLVSRGNNQ